MMPHLRYAELICRIPGVTFFAVVSCFIAKDIHFLERRLIRFRIRSCLLLELELLGKKGHFKQALHFNDRLSAHTELSKRVKMTERFFVNIHLIQSS